MVVVQATGTTTAGVVRLFISLDGGTTWRLWKELLIPAITPSTSVEAHRTVYIPDRPLAMPASAKLGASTHNAETFNVFAHGGDF